MKKIKWQNVTVKHDNSCWAIAISKATGKTYKEVYNLLKPIMSKDGGLNNSLTIGYLQTQGFTKVTLNETSVKETIQHTDTVNNHIIIRYYDGNSAHVFYVHNDTIYDNKDIEYRGQVYEKEVDYIMYKPID